MLPIYQELTAERACGAPASSDPGPSSCRHLPIGSWCPNISLIRKAVLVVLFGSVGCQQIPSAEFQAFNSAVEGARSVGESMLADHAAARREFSQVPLGESTPRWSVIDQGLRGRTQEERSALKRQIETAQQQSRSPQDALGYMSSLSLDLAHASHSAADDAIAIRIQAWKVLEEYNKALASLAAGKSSAEVEGAVKSFFAAVDELPDTFGRLIDASASIAPYGQVLSLAVEAIE